MTQPLEIGDRWGSMLGKSFKRAWLGWVKELWDDEALIKSIFNKKLEK